MQQDHSGGVATGLIFSTLFLVAISSLSWMPRVHIAESTVMTPAPHEPSGGPRGYALASETSVAVTLAPRRGFARRATASREARRKLWRSSFVAVRRPSAPRT
jgi:hypothetical protein